MLENRIPLQKIISLFLAQLRGALSVRVHVT
jgi:hypothetical protein